MKTSRPIGIKYLLMKKNLVTVGIIITGVLSIIMTLLTYYGSYSGNFIVIVDSRDRISSIVLSSTEDFKEEAPRLFADSISDSPPLVFDDLKINNAVMVDGNYIDPDFKYFAYSFYIKNNGNQVVNLEANYLITEVVRNADEAIRVIVVKDKDIDNLTMYKKSDSVLHQYNPRDPIAKKFQDEDNGIVFSEIIEGFQPGEVRKYTVINYVEGNDPDCNDSISGGLIKMTFRFRIVDSKENL